MNRITYHLGLDLGGTKFSGLLLTNEGRELAFHEVPVKRSWNKRDLEDLLQSLASDVAARGSVKPRRIKTLGVGVPGVVSDDGAIQKVINLPALERVDIQQILPQARTNAYNDAACACYAEAMFGSLTHAQVGVHLQLGTGLGTAVMERIDAPKLLGNNTMIHVKNVELGHIAAHIETALSGTLEGKPYELEAYCSKAFFRRETSMPLSELYNEWKEGDHGAHTLFTRFGAQIGSLLATVETIYNPDTITLGGGLTAYLPAYKDVMKTVFRERRFLPDKPAAIKPSSFKEEAGAFGAALYGMLR